jgi:hypothetical protein
VFHLFVRLFPLLKITTNTITDDRRKLLTMAIGLFLMYDRRKVLTMAIGIFLMYDGWSIPDYVSFEEIRRAKTVGNLPFLGLEQDMNGQRMDAAAAVGRARPQRTMMRLPPKGRTSQGEISQSSQKAQS